MPVSIVTWNTQGDPLNNNQKANCLTQLCNNNNIVLLQECGHLAGRASFAGKTILGGYQAGAYNDRCAVAILYDRALFDAGEPMYFSDTGRPGLFVEDQNLVVGTIHATSGGVGARDVTPFAQALARTTNKNFVIGGDLNTDFQVPLINVGSDTRRIDLEVYQPNQPTQQSGARIDGFLAHGTQPTGTMTVGANCVSDHYHVSINF